MSKVCRRSSTGPPQIFTERRARQLADGAFLLAGTSLQCSCELGIHAHLYTWGRAGFAERRSTDVDAASLAKVVAAFGLIGERLDRLPGQLVPTAGFQSRHVLASSYCCLYLLRSGIAWITTSSASDDSTTMTSSGHPSASSPRKRSLGSATPASEAGGGSSK